MFKIILVNLVLLSFSVAQESNRELQERTAEIMEKYCTTCHSSNLERPQGGFGLVDDLESLSQVEKYIIPGDPENSPLVQRVLQDIMPLGASSGIRNAVSNEEKNILVAWVQSLDVEERPFVTQREVTDIIISDLEGLPRSEQRDSRYLTLTNYHNYGVSSERMDIYIAGVIKLINSLSWQKRGHIPEIIDGHILRINLHRLDWSEELWERIANAYPYNLPNSLSPRFQELTGSQRPHLRGDWFAQEASRAPLYHDILDLPNTVRELEALLGVDSSENIARGRVARAGFQDSGVSSNNRLIEWHLSRFGSYWLSYDFQRDSGDGKRNLFHNPLGPNRGGFEHDGGEYIWQLPNGLQAYYLSNAAGDRLGVAPGGYRSG